VGGTETRTVDVRIIAATNRDLVRSVQEGRFRADLYYRLNVFPIALPALRARGDDLPALVGHFVRRFAERYGKPLETVSPALMAALEAHDWPGNVRELEHVIERAVILSRGAELTFNKALSVPIQEGNRGRKPWRRPNAPTSSASWRPPAGGSPARTARPSASGSGRRPWNRG